MFIKRKRMERKSLEKDPYESYRYIVVTSESTISYSGSIIWYKNFKDLLKQIFKQSDIETKDSISGPVLIKLVEREDTFAMFENVDLLEDKYDKKKTR